MGRMGGTVRGRMGTTAAWERGDGGESEHEGIETEWPPRVLQCFIAQHNFMVVVLESEGEA